MMQASQVALVVKNSCLFRRRRFNPWVGKIPWRRKWQPTPVFLPRKFHGQRSLLGYSPWGCKKSDATEHVHTSYLIMTSDSICSPNLCFFSYAYQTVHCISTILDISHAPQTLMRWNRSTLSLKTIPPPPALFSIQINGTQYASKFGKLSSGHRTGKGPFSFQSAKKAMSKNAQTTVQLHSSYMLVK